ncbi:MAG: ribonuclease H [Parcubacteria group bacterium GW2011_GWB1_35_5]|uniref:Ribonuclease H n=1 Tax=Candidatus Zambryskibacteria bacterium RIFCSPLOWO2_01_FULL_35_19 TaxID=1802757 RepID=A0A1G2TYQ6_9BACT|nr:MAG: ribonuclease H [Parcubacteria group bacterium GW2011_GWC1_34_10]KKP80557.1 MAG: ribonuclease H [Parcubacteria group bacterium GW2011_GWB1_35_5]OHA86119.1 MAG: ribonuclease HI [Candidatus Zambryskibacteria bacterium RIFCSPHIGHO2_01_FULL_35_32]OHB02364.1 MAG: ribonuclease HI [Candidatus Zambryskibacteria bacterium RIFCSPLOWO2_01_FULL_35_19]
MSFVEIYTDGSSKGNPGQGGWGAIIFDEEKVLEIGGNEENTTNNRMEMRAAIEALKILPEGAEAKLHTDSEYLMKGITIWILGWQKNNWRTKDKKEVLNKDLWQELWRETEKRKVEWKKVLGHSGHTLNERCDEIAQSLANGKQMKLFEGNLLDYKAFHQE